MSALRISAFVLLAVLAITTTASASATSVIATWSRVGADGTALVNTLSVTGSTLTARVRSSDGSTTTDSGPLTDVNMLAATICAHPQVMMISIGAKSESFHEVGNNPRKPANFYEDMFYLQFGDTQTERRVARALAILTGISVAYYTDCTSSE
jgi:hypothetical protein